MMEMLIRSEAFDHFMQKRFTQVKRYGLEGAEGMMIIMKYLLEISAQSKLN